MRRAFLLYGVERCAMPDRAHRRRQSLRSWSAKPPSAQWNTGTKPEQFTTLLDDLIKLDDNYPLMLATAVCGLWVDDRESCNARRAGWRGQGHQLDVGTPGP